MITLYYQSTPVIQSNKLPSQPPTKLVPPHPKLVLSVSHDTELLQIRLTFQYQIYRSTRFIPHICPGNNKTPRRQSKYWESVFIVQPCLSLPSLKTVTLYYYVTIYQCMNNSSDRQQKNKNFCNAILTRILENPTFVLQIVSNLLSGQVSIFLFQKI